MERWLSIPGYEGAYEVSDLGRVRSLYRVNGQGRAIRGRILTPVTVTGGYQQVNLYRDTRPKMQLVHRLVLTAFAGPPQNGEEARHLNGVRRDNALSNLAWGTRLENMQDMREHGTHKNAVKTHCPQGHPYTGSNLRIEKSGTRRCLTCRRESWRRVSARRSAERKAA